MSYSHAPTPPWRGESDSPSFPQSDRARSETESAYAQDESVLEALREQVVASGQDVEVLLDAITVAARFLTDASGAALGMRRDGAVLCVGRCGETAPELGVRVSEDSGISGECLRAGRTLRCGDTEIDPRVDADVCRALSIRSIAAVPVRSSDSTVGVLEVFSTRADAFTDEHLAFLSSLAGLVETACSNIDFSVTPDVRPVPELGKSPESAPSEPAVNSEFWSDTPWWRQSKWRYTAAAAALVVLLSLAGWRMWRTPARDSAAQVANTPPVQATSEGIPAPTIAESLRKPDPGRAAGGNPGAPTAPLVQASKKEIDEPLVRRFNTTTPAEGNAGTSQPLAGIESSIEPPTIQVLNTGGDAIRGLASAAAAMPTLGVPVSQGVTPPVLERRVTPVYPPQALAQRLEGTVLLQAFVDSTGRVDQVNLLDGPPLLGKAAMDAVRAWRYRPARLNGKPVRTETRITINFQASQAR